MEVSRDIVDYFQRCLGSADDKTKMCFLTHHHTHSSAIHRLLWYVIKYAHLCDLLINYDEKVDFLNDEMTLQLCMHDITYHDTTTLAFVASYVHNNRSWSCHQTRTILYFWT